MTEPVPEPVPEPDPNTGAAAASIAGPLREEAVKKAAIAWLSVGQAPARAVWCMPADAALWVVTGPGEQEVPGLAEADTVVVTLRGDHGGRIISWRAEASRLAPGSDQWDEIAPQLAGKRLNASGDAQAQVTRWAAECAVHRLATTGEMVEAGDTLPAAPLTAPPRPTPARRRTRAPFRLHRVRR